MMNFLYSIIIYPLERAYYYLYLFCAELTGSYGFALFILAVISTIIYTPLKKMASKAQNKERRIQAIMAPQIEKIKQESDGAERHKRLVHLYYRYAYHPILALRSVTGVILQLPFLCAAYYMLIHLPDIQGQTFGAISDLSKPDHLLGGMNVLPLLMTFFNIAAVYVSTSFNRKEQFQSIVLALLFLAILYHAPSALLVYWTINNLLLCIQTIIKYHQIQKTVTMQNGQESKCLMKEPLFQRVCVWILKVIAATLLIYHFFILLYLLYETNELIVNSLMVTLLSSLPLLLFIKWGKKQQYWRFMLIINNIIWLAALFNVACVFWKITIPLLDITFNKVEVYDNNGFFFLSSIVTWLSFMPAIVRCYPKYRIKLAAFMAGSEKQVYFSSVIVLGVLALFFSPTALYLSSPDFFKDSLFIVLVDLLPYTIGYFVVAIFIWFASSPLLHKFLATGILFVTLLSLSNALIFNGEYGALDGLLFNNVIFFGSGLTIIFDLIGFVGAIFIIVLAYHHQWFFKLAISLHLVTLSLVIFCLFSIYQATDRTPDLSISQNSVNGLPDYHDRLYGFSQTKNNVIVFFLDMFTGGDVPKILDKYPDLTSRLSGFVWYEDTVAVGSGTIISAPSMYAGGDYTPEKLNQRYVGEKNSEKQAHSFSVLANEFTQKGYDVSLLGTPFSVPYDTLIKYLDSEVLFVPKFSNSYTTRWMEKLGISKIETSSMSTYMLAISAFRMAPHQIKRKIYRDWQWFGVGKSLFSNQDLFNTLANTAYFALLPEMANNQSQKPTFKFFYNLLSHYPWHLAQESLIPVQKPYQGKMSFAKQDGKNPAHYYSEQHILLLLADFFDWMKQNHIYDNTMIILVSDHDQADSDRLQFKNNPLIYGARPHALFMVKGLNQKGTIKTSKALMATSDIAAMICPLIDGCEGELPLSTDKNRVRKHFIAVDKRNADAYGDFIRYDEYSIIGSMFDENNWHLKRYEDK